MVTFSARSASLFALIFGSIFVSEKSASAQLDLKLPTPNDAIFSDDPSEFYMYTYRTFEGVSSRPWSGGRYGFVRTQRRTDSGMIFTQFHEGIDIRPVKRDANGNPLDLVSAILPGKVVYVNSSAAASSYGKYVVILHEGNIVSLYAHLMTTDVAKGQNVKSGDALGRLGYTGAGINRERAHLHLELALLLSDRFQDWYDLHYTSKNNHGNYSGFNLVGMDVAGFFHAHRANPKITFPEFVAKGSAYYKVVVPNRGEMPIAKRYPWLIKEKGNSTSWEITFAGSGLPMEIRPSDKVVTYPAVTWVRASDTNHSYHTMNRLTGTGDSAKLSGSGSTYIQLLTGAF